MKRRNLFSLSHFNLLTGKMGYLYPYLAMEVLPGDTFQISSSAFLRFSPMVAPVMTPVVVKMHCYYVPLRLLWDESEDFLTGGPDGTSVPVPPYFSSSSNPTGSLADYLGIPTFEGVTVNYSALYHRAYNLIWNEWYRDQSLQDEVAFSTESGLTDSSKDNVNLLRSAWDKDYFTTASPTEQRGVAINVPLVGSGAISANGPFVMNIGSAGSESDLSLGQLYAAASSTTVNGNVGVKYSGDIAGTLTPSPLSYKSGLQLDTGDGLGINLNQWREAMALQRFEEHRQIYGSRYVEYLRYLGVKASDARLQRPEYLGGGRSVIQFSEVLQTAEGTDPVGTMRGHGIGAMRTNRLRRFFEEHGIVMGLLSIRPKSIYTQGLPRKFSRLIKTDYWQKELEHIGQQEVKNSEVFAASSDPSGTFGYSDRYNEYRSEWSSVHGEFRDLLNYWHLGREFSAQPTLNSDFISSLPSDRIFADQTGNDTIYLMVNNSVQARRLVSRRGNPR